jgi:hypothetical protein
MIPLLREALGRHPFLPVTVVLSNGELVRIENQNFAAVLAQAGLLYVESPSDPEPRFINLRLVREIRTKDLTPEFGDS